MASTKEKESTEGRDYRKELEGAGGDVALQLSITKDFVKNVLEEGVDYGEIPGIKTPSLFKPGAEKLCALFGVARHLEVIDFRLADMLDKDGNDVQHTCYTVKCTLIDENGRVRGTGIGAANSAESKFKYAGFSGQNNLVKMSNKRCLGSTTPVIYKYGNKICSANISQLFNSWAGTEPNTFFLPGSDGSWRTIKGMVREEDRETYNVALRDGFSMHVTANHEFPTTQGLKEVKDLKVGDKLLRTPIILTKSKGESALPDFGWLAGLFLAEGHIRDNTVHFTLSVKEQDVLSKIREIVTILGLETHSRIDNNTLRVSINGPSLVGLINQFVVEKNSHHKHLSRYCWNQDANFLNSLLEGYLTGDGSYQEGQGRNVQWNLNFSGKNFKLSEDLRTLCAVLGKRISLKLVDQKSSDGKMFKAYRGWIKDHFDNSYNLKCLEEITSIEKDNKKACVYDIEVDGDHLFALSNGIVTHNSLVDAALTMSLVSGMFTQDVEDMDIEPKEKSSGSYSKPAASKPASAPAKTYPQENAGDYSNARPWKADQTFRFGKEKDKTIKQASSDNLEWYIGNAVKGIEEGKFVENNVGFLQAALEELKDRGDDYDEALYEKVNGS